MGRKNEALLPIVGFPEAILRQIESFTTTAIVAILLYALAMNPLANAAQCFDGCIRSPSDPLPLDVSIRRKSAARSNLLIRSISFAYSFTVKAPH